MRVNGYYVRKIYICRKSGYMEELIRLDNVEQYNRLYGLETLHPMVSVIDLSRASMWPKHMKIS